MANVLCLLASDRSNGYTADLLNSVTDGIESVPDVSFEVAKITNFLPISPCLSCWNCYRNEDHRCTLDDSMGRMGKGELFEKVVNANGLFIAQPVYYGRPPAVTHLFLERLYPFMWSRELNGMPFASLSQAGNNGGARSANLAMARWAYTWYFKYIGGLPVHLIYLEEAKIKANYLGEKIAIAAKKDVKERIKITPVERYLRIDGNPWNQLEPFIENLTNGTYSYEESLIEYALSHRTVKKPESIELLKKASEELKLTLYYYKLGNREKTAEHLVKTRSYFSPATSKEFLEDIVNKN